MDRQEYREIINEIKAGYKNKDYERVIMFAQEIPTKKIKENSAIEMIATAYDQVGKPALARTTLEVAYKRMPGGKQTAYKLAKLALKTGDIEGAVGYYEDFCRIAPNDNQRFILKYEIAKEGGLSIYDKIRILEEYTAKETDDKWMYELARLYHEAGMGDQCAEMCDEIVIWFSDGDYLKRALELKFSHKALTPTQQAMYERIMQDYIEDYEEPEPEIEEPSMSEEFEAEAFAKDYLENAKDPFADTRPIENLEDEDEDSALGKTKKISLRQPSAKEEPISKNIFYDFRIEDATLNPDPKLDQWLASLPDIKDINKASEPKASEETDNVEETPAEKKPEQDKVFADIPVSDESMEAIYEAPAGSDAVLENLSDKDEKLMAETNVLFNEPIAEEAPAKPSFEDELKKLSPALESIRETPLLNPEFDKKKVEFEEGQLGINLELLKKDDNEVEGQFSIDQLFQTYANNIENNLENKAAVAKVEAERLKQIREAVERSMPEAPIISFDDEDEAEVTEEYAEEAVADEVVVEEDAVEVSEEAGANADPDMDEEDRWDEDPVEKILSEYVAKQPVKQAEPVTPVAVADPAEEEAKEIEIPDFLKNIQFDETEEEPENEFEEELEEDFDENEALADEESADEVVIAKTTEEELDEIESFLANTIAQNDAEEKAAAAAEPVKSEEEELDELEDSLLSTMGSDDAAEAATEETAEETAEEIKEETSEEIKEETTEESVEAAGEAEEAADAAEEEIDEELDELGDTLAAIFGEDAEPEETEEAVSEETEAEEIDLAALEESIEDATKELEAEEPEEAEAEEPAVEEVEEEVTEPVEEAGEETEETTEEETAEADEGKVEEAAEAAAEEAAEDIADEVEETAEEAAEETEETADEAIEETDETAEEASEETAEEIAEEAEETAEEIEEEEAEEAEAEEAAEEAEYAEEAEAEETAEAEEAAEEAGEDAGEDATEDEELDIEALIDEAAEETEAEEASEADETEEAVAAEAEEETEATAEDAASDEEDTEASEEETEEIETADVEAEEGEGGISGDTQEIEKVHKFTLDAETREEIAEFMLIEGMGEKITNTIDNIILTIKSGDTTGGNLIVTGDGKTGKTFLAISMIKAVNKELNAGSGKVAKVQSESLNGKDIDKVFQKIAGNDLIIENVGYLEEQTINDIIEVMQNGKAHNMVVLEGNMLAVETMINKHPEIEKLFENRVDVNELTITQWADVACDYAMRKGYKVTDMALLALHAKIDEINLPTSRFGYEDIVNIMETAIEKCEKRNTGKLFSAFSRKEDEYIELNESDFV